MKKEIEYILSEPIKYHHKGQELETDKLILYSPSANQRKNAFKLAQLLSRALKSCMSLADMNKNRESINDDTEMDANAIVNLILMSDIEIEEFINIFEMLLLNGIAKLDGQENLTKTLIDRLSFDDLKNLLGEYIANFLSFSGTTQMKNK